MALHNEIAFETEICEYLGQHGWLYRDGDAADYDRARALFPNDVIEWIKATQPKTWDSLEKSLGTSTSETVLDSVRSAINSKGTLELLRRGFDVVGLRQSVSMAQFKPAIMINADILASYEANRLRVVRQVRYSLHNQNCIDLVLFLNGIPVATVELKTDFTQSVEDAVDQYRFDRHPKPKGQGSSEPLLSFPNGALVHFAVSNAEVRMTTKLEGAQTIFLPFNQGNNGQAGNPADRGGHPTTYLWEEVWERESWLEIIGRYLITLRDRKKQIAGTIFPRYHQLDATRKLVQSVLAEGPGGEYLQDRFHYSGKYLIQHSAGSGKTNSIAWTAHFLAELHRGDEKLFDSVLVVSDRNVLDAQLQDAIFSFQRTTGVVQTITSEGGAKSGQLAQALAGDKKIVICTIQTFPFALKEIENLTATKGKRFAVIADEAHSSQSGEAATKLKKVLSADEIKDLADGGEVSNEDIFAAEMESRAKSSSVTFIAFTATPKAKTMELFGRPPDQSRPTSDENKPAPFHVYSMQQAIQEGFILDVLKNYTPYSLAFKLSQLGEHGDGVEVDEGQAKKSLIRWVKLHEFNISQKVQVIVEHFRKNVAPLLDGKAKAMVVLSSRLEAVRWKLAIDKYIASCGYAREIGTLAAFSGEVIDPESGPDPFAEKSKSLNPKLEGRDIRDAFATDDFQILLVANKFQTGFDQPLLCGMYVDKRLAGIQAVQTLSRLNRAHPGKDTTYVLDFVNDPEEILTAFRMYQATAELESVTDPQTLFALKDKLDGQGFYSDNEVDRVINVVMDPNSKQSELIAALEPVASRIMGSYKEAAARLKSAKDCHDADSEKHANDEISVFLLLKRDMGSYVRMYSFLSQIFDYGNPVMEKRFIFFKHLIPLLEFGRERETIDFSKVSLTHYKLIKKGTWNPPSDGETTQIPGIGESGTGALQCPDRMLLEEIIEKVNDLFKGELTDDDKLVYVNRVIKGKLLESEVLGKQAVNNSREQFASSPDLGAAIMNAIIEALDAHTTMSKQALDSTEVREGLKDILLGPAQLWEALRGKYGNDTSPSA